MTGATRSRAAIPILGALAFLVGVPIASLGIWASTTHVASACTVDNNCDFPLPNCRLPANQETIFRQTMPLDKKAPFVARVTTIRPLHFMEREKVHQEVYGKQPYYSVLVHIDEVISSRNDFTEAEIVLPRCFAEHDITSGISGIVVGFDGLHESGLAVVTPVASKTQAPATEVNAEGTPSGPRAAGTGSCFDCFSPQVHADAVIILPTKHHWPLIGDSYHPTGGDIFLVSLGCCLAAAWLIGRRAR